VTLTTRTSALLAAALLGLAFANTAGAATVKVNCATQNLQNKINAAPAGSTILVKGTCAGTFTVSKRLTLKGNPTATLDGNDGGSVLSIDGSAPLHLIRLRIIDGTASVGGGIVAVGGAPLTLDHVTVSGNVAETAGGGIGTDGPVTLRNSSVTGNLAEFHASGSTVRGGGILALSVRLTDSIVRGNRAHAIGDANPANAYGGGILVAGGGVVATRSHIDSNTARADGSSATALGGGIAQQFGTARVRLTSSTVSKNAAGGGSVGSGRAQGGGVHAGRVVATRTKFIGNRVDVFAELSPGTVGGGALYVTGAGATLTAVQIRNSRANVAASEGAVAAGGGVASEADSGKLSITGSSLTGNTASAESGAVASEGYGGAVFADGPIAILRSTVSGNALKVVSHDSDAIARGGGIDAEGSLVLQSSAVSGNLARATSDLHDSSAVGGGIGLVKASAANRIVNSTITLNAARAFGSTVTVGTVADAEGGAVYAALASFTLTNATVARNTISAQGVILFVRGGGVVNSTATIELRGTILAGNTAPDGRDCGGPVTSLGYNLVGSTSGCTFAGMGSDKQNRPAKLGTFGNHGGKTKTIALAKGSPALNAIPKSACTVRTDQRGVKRPKEKRCEIGAFERNPQ
jgi:hypothetical protein